MDKITRILLLYSKLMKGEEVDKIMFCFENNCSSRTFERDIEDIRLYLTNHAKNSPTSIGGEMNWHKKLSLDNRKKIEYTNSVVIKKKV